MESGNEERLECLEAVTRCTPTVGPKDGSFTLQYKSAMAIGKAEVVTDKDEKIEALRAICLRFLHISTFHEHYMLWVAVVVAGFLCDR